MPGIDLTEKGYYLIDEGSKNGTFIGDRAIHSHPLDTRHIISNSRFRLTFVNDLGVEDQIQTGGATISKQYAESWDEATCTGLSGRWNKYGTPAKSSLAD